jgi:hypothetical protein
VEVIGATSRSQVCNKPQDMSIFLASEEGTETSCWTMDPVTAIGMSSAVLTFVDVGARIVRGAGARRTFHVDPPEELQVEAAVSLIRGEAQAQG